MIIDCHTHLNNYHDEDVASLASCLEDLQLHMRRNRVDVALVLTSYKITPGRPSTRDVVNATREIGNIHVVAGITYGNLASHDLGEVREYLQDGSVRGLKLYPGYEPFYPHDPGLEPVYRLAADTNVPVMIHSGDTFTPRGKVKYSHPIHIDEVAVDHPEVNFVICHLGNPWIRDCMEVVYKNKNVFTDISGLVLGQFSDRFERFMSNQVQEMLEYGVEAEKVLFGTDWPISSMESYVAFMEELKLPEKEKRKIMFDNTAKLFRIPASDSPMKNGSVFDRLRDP